MILKFVNCYIFCLIALMSCKYNNSNLSNIDSISISINSTDNRSYKGAFYISISKSNIYFRTEKFDNEKCFVAKLNKQDLDSIILFCTKYTIDTIISSKYIIEDEGLVFYEIFINKYSKSKPIRISGTNYNSEIADMKLIEIVLNYSLNKNDNICKCEDSIFKSKIHLLRFKLPDKIVDSFIIPTSVNRLIN